MLVKWEPDDYNIIGLLGLFLDDENPASAREQLDANYQHGGGYQPFEGFTMLDNLRIVYPGDPPYSPIAQAQLRDEKVVLYPHSWVAVVQSDGSWVIARMD